MSCLSKTFQLEIDIYLLNVIQKTSWWNIKYDFDSEIKTISGENYGKITTVSNTLSSPSKYISFSGEE